MTFYAAACQTDFPCPSTRAEIADRTRRMCAMVEQTIIGYEPFFEPFRRPATRRSPGSSPRSAPACGGSSNVKAWSLKPWTWRPLTHSPRSHWPWLASAAPPYRGACLSGDGPALASFASGATPMPPA